MASKLSETTMDELQIFTDKCTSTLNTAGYDEFGDYHPDSFTSLEEEDAELFEMTEEVRGCHEQLIEDGQNYSDRLSELDRTANEYGFDFHGYPEDMNELTISNFMNKDSDNCAENEEEAQAFLAEFKVICEDAATIKADFNYGLSRVIELIKEIDEYVA